MLLAERGKDGCQHRTGVNQCECFRHELDSLARFRPEYRAAKLFLPPKMILSRFNLTDYRVFRGADKSYAGHVRERFPALRDATRVRGRNANLSVSADWNRNIESAVAVFAIPL